MLCLCGACNAFSPTEKSMTSGLKHILSDSSLMMIGLVADPSCSSFTTAGTGSLTLRQVARRAKQARAPGAIDEVDETVEMEEMEDARDERDRSDINDSGLEPKDAALIDVRREAGGCKPGKTSIAHLLNPAVSAKRKAENMEGRREPQTLAAGVLEATDDGVICGVGNGPILTNAGVGGWRSGFGSKKRGGIVSGVGVPSCEVESMRIRLNALVVGVGVAVGDANSISAGHRTADAGRELW